MSRGSAGCMSLISFLKALCRHQHSSVVQKKNKQAEQRQTDITSRSEGKQRHLVVAVLLAPRGRGLLWDNVVWTCPTSVLCFQWGRKAEMVLEELAFRLNDRGYINWLKAGRCLVLLRDGLHPFISHHTRAFHGDLLNRNSLLRKPCESSCRPKGTKVWSVWSLHGCISFGTSCPCCLSPLSCSLNSSLQRDCVTHF